MAKGREQNIDRRPGKEIFRELLDALAEGDVSVEDGGRTPTELIVDILRNRCPPCRVASPECFNKPELDHDTCWNCWYEWWEEGA